MDRLLLGKARRIAAGVLALGVAAAAMGAALRGLEWGSFKAQLRSLDGRWLALAIAFDIASYVAQGLRWRILLEGSTWFQTTRAIYVGLFLNEIAPLRPGEAVRGWLISRKLGVSLLRVAPTMIAERLMDGLWLAAGVLGALAIAPLPEQLRWAAWAVVAIAGGLAAVAWIAGRARYEALRVVRSGLTNAWALAASGLFLGAQGLAYWAVMRASHFETGLAAAIVVMVVVRIGTLIPGAPANLGTHQFSTVLGLSLFGVRQAQAAGFSIVLFTVLTAPLLMIGLGASLNTGLTWSGLWKGAGGSEDQRVATMRSLVGDNRRTSRNPAARSQESYSASV